MRLTASTLSAIFPLDPSRFTLVSALAGVAPTSPSCVLVAGHEALAWAPLYAAVWPDADVSVSAAPHSGAELVSLVARSSGLDRLTVHAGATDEPNGPFDLAVLADARSNTPAQARGMLAGRLVPGALVVVGYPALAGNAPLASVRALVELVARRHAGSPTVEIAELAQALIGHLLDVGAHAVTIDPAAAEWARAFVELQPEQAIAEVVRPMRPTTFGAMADAMAELGLRYLGPLDPIATEDRGLDPEIVAHLDDAGSPALREMILDVATGAVHRCDVFHAGTTNLTDEARGPLLSGLGGDLVVGPDGGIDERHVRRLVSMGSVTQPLPTGIGDRLAALADAIHEVQGSYRSTPWDGLRLDPTRAAFTPIEVTS